MPDRNVVALSSLMAIILALTALIGQGVAKPLLLGGLAPLLILTLLTWYLIILIVNRNEIIAGVAEIFKMRRKREFVRTSIWSTIVAYASLLLLAVLVLWMGVPQRILGQIQRLTVSSGTGGTSNLPQTNQLIGFLPARTFIYFGAVILGAIFVVSFVLLIGGMRLASIIKKTPASDTQLGIEQDAAEVVQQTIAALKEDKEDEYHEIILECYKKMCKILERVGITVSPADTAREFAETISTKLKIGQEAISGLTFLFEEARYSNHEISEDKRVAALTYLTSLRQNLSAKLA